MFSLGREVTKRAKLSDKLKNGLVYINTKDLL